MSANPLEILKNDETSVLRQIAQLEGALLYIRQFRATLTKDEEKKPTAGEPADPDGNG
jgi:hypothetical protein